MSEIFLLFFPAFELKNAISNFFPAFELNSPKSFISDLPENRWALTCSNALYSSDLLQLAGMC